jgi:predicted dehydrogenase
MSFVENQLAPTVEECYRIVKLEEKRGRKLMVGQNLRLLLAHVSLEI